MNDTAPSDAITALRERARELHRERDLIDARLAEVADMIELIETPKRKPRIPRSPLPDNIARGGFAHRGEDEPSAPAA
jgi:hypothetical protein